MKTGLKKSQKTTEIFFDEASRWIMVRTYNTDLKNRLTAYAKKHPDLCRLTDDTEDGGLSFEVAKGRFCFRLTEPYSDERRAAASEFAKKQNNRLRNHKVLAGFRVPFSKATHPTAAGGGCREDLLAQRSKFCVAISKLRILGTARGRR